VRIGEIVGCLGQQPARDACQEVQLPGLVGCLTALQKGKQGVLCLDQVPEKLGQRALRISQRQALHIVA
jgi:hypothetical protein